MVLIRQGKFSEENKSHLLCGGDALQNDKSISKPGNGFSCWMS
jgi:hypothetical protein